VASYLWFFWTIGLGPLASLATVLGIGVVVARRDRAGLAILSFVLPYLLFFLAWPQHMWRNLLPIVPPLMLLAAVGISAMASGLAQLIERVWSIAPDRLGSASHAILIHLGTPALTALVVAAPLISAIQLDRFDMQPDVRMQAVVYIRDDLSHRRRIAVEFDPAQWAGNRDVVPVGSLTMHNVDWYRAQGFRYLVANGRYRTHDNQLAYAHPREAATLVRSFDDRQLATRLGNVMMLTRTFVSRPNRAWVEVLDLGAH
jgi:hypothetical protein